MAPSIPMLHDLSDDDIESRSLEPSLSAVALSHYYAREPPLLSRYDPTYHVGLLTRYALDQITGSTTLQNRSGKAPDDGKCDDGAIHLSEECVWTLSSLRHYS